MTRKAPPTKDRPLCQLCGKRLKPNYRTEDVTEKIYVKPEEVIPEGTQELYFKTQCDTVWVPWSEVDPRGSEGSLTRVPVHYDEDGKPYYEMVVAREKKWDGTYGGFSDNSFCGKDCGYYWAVAVNLQLKKRGEVWTCYKKEEKETEE